MISAKQAVASASNYVHELIDGSRDHRLEEVVLQEFNALWKVVISFKLDGSIDFANLNGRLFKEVDVDAESGEPKSLKIWKA